MILLLATLHGTFAAEPSGGEPPGEPPPGMAAEDPPPAEPGPPGARPAAALLPPTALFSAPFSAWVAQNPPSPHPEPLYHFSADLLAEIAPLAESLPGIVRPFVVGRTLEDRPIWGFHLQDPSRRPDYRVLVVAQIHALEWVPSEVALAFLKTLAERPHKNVAVDVIPMLNPDGRARVEADLRAGKNTYRRGNAARVDLNRDFLVHREATAIWRHLVPRRYSTSPAPLSQPESRALDALAARERYDAAVSLHAYGGYIYYPWAGSFDRAPDWRHLEEVATAMSAGMVHPYRPKQLSHWAFWFRGQGMELDHLYGRYGTDAFLVETTHSGLSPFRPSEWKTHFRWYNPHDPREDVEDNVRMLRALVGQVGGIGV